MAREAAGTPLLVVRGDDGAVRAFRNACRHRGTRIAEGSGCDRAFTCRYHGWVYGLDGSLRHVPHEYGFPGLEKESHGLVPVACEEASGIVFVTQQPPGSAATKLDALPPLITETHRLVGTRELAIAANWKILVEGFLEGYHIRSTHPRTFYPLQYDNVNVVERFGRNNRIAFPYQSIERQRDVSPDHRTADGTLTYLNHLFPNAVVATFPGRVILAILEPDGLERTLQTTWAFTDRPADDRSSQAFLESGRDLVDAGTEEDRAVACAIQRGLASEANKHFTYGRFEAAIVHFHRELRDAIDSDDRGSGARA
jgi:phenylpropionate dioxygenase-like ring-hydroxylating dioxygenase large terminal subunit